MSDTLWRSPRTCGTWLAIPCAAAGAALLMLALARVMGLQYATVPDRWLIFMLVLMLAALSLALLALEGCGWQLCLLCLLPVGAALARVCGSCSYRSWRFLFCRLLRLHVVCAVPFAPFFRLFLSDFVPPGIQFFRRGVHEPLQPGFVCV